MARPTITSRGIIAADEMPNCRRQQRVPKQWARSAAQCHGGAAGTVTGESDRIPVVNTVEEIGGYPISGQLKNGLRVRTLVGGSERLVGFHPAIIAPARLSRHGPPRSRAAEGRTTVRRPARGL